MRIVALVFDRFSGLGLLLLGASAGFALSSSVAQGASPGAILSAAIERSNSGSVIHARISGFYTFENLISATPRVEDFNHLHLTASQTCKLDFVLDTSAKTVKFFNNYGDLCEGPDAAKQLAQDPATYSKLLEEIIGFVKFADPMTASISSKGEISYLLLCDKAPSFANIGSNEVCNHMKGTAKFSDTGKIISNSVRLQSTAYNTWVTYYNVYDFSEEIKQIGTRRARVAYVSHRRASTDFGGFGVAHFRQYEELVVSDLTELDR